jgi:hypothetical protein
MRLTISERPCNVSSRNPAGINNLTGQRSSPPASADTSWRAQDSTRIGQDNTMMTIAIGSRKKMPPNRSIQARWRAERWANTTSIRTCSLCSKV